MRVLARLCPALIFLPLVLGYGGVAPLRTGQERASDPTQMPPKVVLPTVVLPRTTPTTCPRLDPELAAFVTAPDRDAFAKYAIIDYKDGRVLVEIQLAADTGPGDLPARYDLRVRAHAGGLLDVYALPDRLCELADDPRVLAVRVPARAVPA